MVAYSPWRVRCLNPKCSHVKELGVNYEWTSRSLIPICRFCFNPDPDMKKWLRPAGADKDVEWPIPRLEKYKRQTRNQWLFTTMCG